KFFAYYGFRQERSVFYGMPYMRTVQMFRLSKSMGDRARAPLPIVVDSSTRTELLWHMLYTDTQRDSIRQSYGIRRLPRAGWVRKNVSHPETVADHTWAVTLLALLLAPPAVDKNRLAAMAVVHDISEGIMMKDYVP